MKVILVVDIEEGPDYDRLLEEAGEPVRVLDAQPHVLVQRWMDLSNDAYERDQTGAGADFWNREGWRYGS